MKTATYLQHFQSVDFKDKNIKNEKKYYKYIKLLQ